MTQRKPKLLRIPRRIFDPKSSQKLSLSQKSIRNYSKKITEDYADIHLAYRDRYERLIEAQYMYEKGYLEAHYNRVITECKPSQKDLVKVDYNVLNKMQRSEYFNINFLKFEGCLINAYTPFSNKDGSLRYKDIKSLFDDIVIISSGHFGIVGVSDSDDIKDLFVVKYDKGKSKDEEIYHELYVTNILNKIRSRLPNFMYIFGYFKCDSPIDTGIRNIRSVCNVEGPKIFSVYERIHGPSLRNYVSWEKVTLEGILNYYLQVLFSLLLASDFLEFSHNDLHDENVILRKLDETMAIPYTMEGVTYYLETDRIATLIDFGQSFIKYGNKTQGVFWMEEHGAFWDTPNYLMDSYKLFMFMCYDLVYVESNDNAGKKTVKLRNDTAQHVFDQLIPLFNFFVNVKDPRQYLKTEYSNLFIIHFSQKNKGTSYKHSDLVKYIIRSYPVVQKFLGVKTDRKIARCSPKGDMKCGKVSLDPDALYTYENLFFLIQTNNLTTETLNIYREKYLKDHMELELKLWGLENTLLTNVITVMSKKVSKVDNTIDKSFLKAISDIKEDIAESISLISVQLIRKTTLTTVYNTLEGKDVAIDSKVMLDIARKSISLDNSIKKLSGTYNRIIAHVKLNRINLDLLEEKYPKEVNSLYDTVKVLSKIKRMK